MIANLAKVCFLLVFYVVGVIPPAMAHYCQMQGYTAVSDCPTCAGRDASSKGCCSRVSTKRTVSTDRSCLQETDQSCCSIEIRDPFTVAAAGIIVAESVTHMERVHFEPATNAILTIPLLMPLDQVWIPPRHLGDPLSPHVHLTGGGFLC